MFWLRLTDQLNNLPKQFLLLHDFLKGTFLNERFLKRANFNYSYFFKHYIVSFKRCILIDFLFYVKYKILIKHRYEEFVWATELSFNLSCNYCGRLQSVRSVRCITHIYKQFCTYFWETCCVHIKIYWIWRSRSLLETPAKWRNCK